MQPGAIDNLHVLGDEGLILRGGSQGQMEKATSEIKKRIYKAVEGSNFVFTG